MTLGFAALSAATAVSAQVAPPPAGLARVELERSRACVEVLESLDALDMALAPLAARSQRLLGLA